jgi:phosphoglycolate phosphatase
LNQLVIYDLDGTLVDSAQIVTGILNSMRQEIGKSPIDKMRLLPLLSRGGEELVSGALELTQSAQISLALEEFRGRYLEFLTPPDSLYPNVVKTLEQLQALNCSLGICTNKPRNLVNKVLADLNLGQFFSFISAGGDLPTKKPHPDNLRVCLEHFGVQPNQALLVGDSTVDQSLARNLDVHFVHYTPGYDDGVVFGAKTTQISDHLDIVNALKSVKS